MELTMGFNSHSKNVRMLYKNFMIEISFKLYRMVLLFIKTRLSNLGLYRTMWM